MQRDPCTANTQVQFPLQEILMRIMSRTEVTSTNLTLKMKCNVMKNTFPSPPHPHSLSDHYAIKCNSINFTFKKKTNFLMETVTSSLGFGCSCLFPKLTLCERAWKKAHSSLFSFIQEPSFSCLPFGCVYIH